MRRAIAGAVTSGLLFAGAVATPAGAADGGSATTAKTTKTVVYEGYEFQVPASWPVYRLDQDPQACVRYDIHAVYLGTPGTDMRCPAGLVGRTQTVSFIPGQAGQAGPAAANASQPGAAGGTELQRLPAVHSAVTQDAVQHELQVELGTTGSSATVLGTYDTDPSAIEQVFNTLHLAPAGAAPTAQTASARTLAQPPADRARPDGETALPQRAAAPAKPAPSKPAPSKAAPPRPAPAKSPTAKPAPATGAAATPAPAATYTNWHGVPSHWPSAHVQPPQQPAPTATATPAPTATATPAPKATPTASATPTPSTTPKPPSPKPSPPDPPAPKASDPVGGFDTCTAPSLANMKVFRTDYSAVGIYLGGVNSACAYGNLSASWVKSVAAMGYGMLPTYVGQQAPCWNGTGALINPKGAVAQANSDAADAVRKARQLGLPAGSPIYYDMEAYAGNASCTAAVLAFLGAWDRQLTAGGYVTGVYSSQDSGITDMQHAVVSKTAGFTPPTALWFALWDNKPTLSDGSLSWPVTDRNKQYAGNVNATVRGVTLNVDKDVVGGPVAR